MKDGYQLSRHMRSNDVFRGLPHDLFCFTMLQELIARSVGVELGSYHHMVGSLHMYEEDAKQLEEFIAEGWQATSRRCQRCLSAIPAPVSHTCSTWSVSLGQACHRQTSTLVQNATGQILDDCLRRTQSERVQGIRLWKFAKQ